MCMDLCMFWDPVCFSNKFSFEGGHFSCCNPHRFLEPKFLRLSFPALEAWVTRSLSLPSCSSQFIHTQIWHCPVHQSLSCLLQSTNHCLTCLVLQVPPCCVSSLTQLPISMPPISLNECFLCNSLVVRSPYSSIFWKLWLFFVYKLLSFFWLCEEVKCFHLCLHLEWNS